MCCWRAILARMNSLGLIVNSFAAGRHVGGINSANAGRRSGRTSVALLWMTMSDS